MTRWQSLRAHPGHVLWMTAVWVALWGSASAANVLGGLVVAVVLLLLLPVPEPNQPRSRVRPLALLRFTGFFAVELVKASATVVFQVLRPRSHLHSAVLAVDAVGASDRLLTLVANAVSLTPGTLTLEVDTERSVLYVHALHVGGPEGLERTRRSIERLERLAVLAAGSPECLARLEESVRRRGSATEGEGRS